MTTPRPTPWVATLATNPLAQATVRASAAYQAYVAACHAEACEAHGPHLWVVHGCPTGPLG